MLIRFAIKDKVSHVSQCDVAQLLDRSRVPYVLVSGGSSYVAEASERLQSISKGYESAVVVTGHGAILSAAAVSRLGDAASTSPDGVAAPLTPNSRAVQDLPKAARQFASHPLNFARADACVRGEAVGGPASSVGVVVAFAVSRVGSLEVPVDSWLTARGTKPVEVDAYAYVWSDPSDLFPTPATNAFLPKLATHRGFAPKADMRAKEGAVLFAITTAGVWERTLCALISFEGHSRDHVDLLIAATPRPGDATADFLEAAGYRVFRQAEAVGLTNLWNSVVAYAFRHGYDHFAISNNDVIVPDGAIYAMSAALRAPSPVGLRSPKPPVVSAVPNPGGGSYYFFDADGHAEADYVTQPLTYARVGDPSSRARPKLSDWAVTNARIGFRLPGWTAYCFMVDAKWARTVVLDSPDMEPRLWNDTRWKNFGQETELSKRTRIKIEHVPDAFVFHFRGGTLGAKECQNGHRDCATWQKGHRRDMRIEV